MIRRAPRREAPRLETPSRSPRTEKPPAQTPITFKPPAPSDQYQSLLPPRPLAPIEAPRPSGLPGQTRDEQVRDGLVGELERRVNTPIDTRNLTPLEAGLQELSRGLLRTQVESARADPSGAALIRLAANQFVQDLSAAAAGQPVGRLYAGALSNEVELRISTISPKVIARDGFAATLMNVLKDIRDASTRLSPEFTQKQPPSEFELILGG